MKHVIDGIELPAFPWAWHQQGDANDHVLLTSGSQWVIAFRTNGEFMPAKENAVVANNMATRRCIIPHFPWSWSYLPYPSIRASHRLRQAWHPRNRTFRQRA